MTINSKIVNSIKQSLDSVQTYLTSDDTPREEKIILDWFTPSSTKGQLNFNNNEVINQVPETEIWPISVEVKGTVSSPLFIRVSDGVNEGFAVINNGNESTIFVTSNSTGPNGNRIPGHWYRKVTFMRTPIRISWEGTTENIEIRLKKYQRKPKGLYFKESDWQSDFSGFWHEDTVTPANYVAKFLLGYRLTSESKYLDIAGKMIEYLLDVHQQLFPLSFTSFEDFDIEHQTKNALKLPNYETLLPVTFGRYGRKDGLAIPGSPILAGWHGGGIEQTLAFAEYGKLTGDVTAVSYGKKLADSLIELFYHSNENLSEEPYFELFFTGSKHDKNITRSIETYDVSCGFVYAIHLLDTYFGLESRFTESANNLWNNHIVKLESKMSLEDNFDSGSTYHINGPNGAAWLLAMKSYFEENHNLDRYYEYAQIANTAEVDFLAQETWAYSKAGWVENTTNNVFKLLKAQDELGSGLFPTNLNEIDKKVSEFYPYGGKFYATAWCINALSSVASTQILTEKISLDQIELV